MLTTAQAAAILGVNPSRVRQLILDGKIKAVKFGRDNMIAERDLEKYRKSPPPKKGRPRKDQRNKGEKEHE